MDKKLKTNPKVEPYFKQGCGRCPYYDTPECKIHNWTTELKKLRSIILDLDLKEELKWSVPCYTNNEKNVILLSAFKEYCAISFFKGTLIKDTKKILLTPGKNSQASRYLKFTNTKEIDKFESTIINYIKQAIEIEKKGHKVEFKKNPEPVPQELQFKLDKDRNFKKAFEALTPGRQRGYILHFSQPKQSKTRQSRIEKYTPKILAGKGFHDR